MAHVNYSLNSKYPLNEHFCSPLYVNPSIIKPSLLPLLFTVLLLRWMEDILHHVIYAIPQSQHVGLLGDATASPSGLLLVP